MPHLKTGRTTDDSGKGAQAEYGRNYADEVLLGAHNRTGVAPAFSLSPAAGDGRP